MANTNHLPAPVAGRFSAMLDDLDDWCGTKPPRHFPPHPGGLRDAMIAVVIYELASRVADEKLRTGLQGAAMQLHQAGAKAMLG